MKKYKMISNYMDNEKYRSSFNKLAVGTFGLDFEDWYKNKLFYNRYICYSFVDRDEIIANISINKMNLIIKNQKKKALQIGTVMTHPEYRNQGLSAALMKHIIEKYENDYDIIYLFANDSVLNFYPKFGFKKAEEYFYELDAAQINKKQSQIRKLNKENEEDYKIILRLAENRQPVSQKLGICNDIWPLLVYCLYEYSNDLYYLEDEDIIVIAVREGDRLHIYDILTLEPFILDNIIEKFVLESDKIIEIHFVPELMKYNVIKGYKQRKNDTLFLRSKEDLSKEILFPMTSHT
ncbi:GNAT family N-acetyltransferase [Clostridium sp. YIM B02515]|uniref:GNAT family N-acetyltransferase n=1 Tax=Clostridium rhizosphaerae TaxID=2803861 RepID=A0ABS1TGI5_9CLOT|nr:GNAT family N-acetyltransferase [Clostridium rhizosphaerae]MBL4937429.1 GNAT family N-acetyltransferase [Clostridium rhizosphaerae]